MKALIVFDSQYGCTEKVARTVEAAIAPSGEVKAMRPGEVDAAALGSVDLLVVGSPTQGGRPTPAMAALLGNIKAGGLKNLAVAAFDTRIKSRLAGIFGYAAGRIESVLKDRGGRPVAPAAGFFVTGTKGPLKDGEVERAATWARQVLEGSLQK